MQPVNNKQIVIVTGASLSFNPRVLKEAIALCRAGYKVRVLGANIDVCGLQADNALAQRHGFAFTSVASLAGSTIKDRVRSVYLRCRSKLGRILSRIARFENRFQLGVVVPDLLAQAVAADADYYIVHLEQSLWVGSQLIHAGFQVGVDVEDWYSEDLLPEARQNRPIRLLRSLEREVLRGASHRTSPSRAMSEALAVEYGCPSPTVIYNAFAWKDRESLEGQMKDRKSRKVPSIHWYSQTLGHGRGLEDLLAALPFLRHAAEIHLRGRPVAGFDEWLAARVPEPWRKRIFIHDLVSNEELLSRIVEHDIGFAGEQKYCRSKDVTVSNKILHYLLGGLAVVASDTAGQREIAEQAPGAVAIYPSGDAQALAVRLNRLLEHPDGLEKAKASALHAAESTFCWERMEPVLLRSVDEALSRPLSARRRTCMTAEEDR